MFRCSLTNKLVHSKAEDHKINTKSKDVDKTTETIKKTKKDDGAGGKWRNNSSELSARR